MLLHGFAMHGGLFAPLLPALIPRFRVHVVDLPGHGWSAPMATPDLAGMVATIDAATAAIGEPVVVVGWSLGGQVALQWALARPDRVRRLVLVATTPSFVTRDGWPSAMAAETLARFGDELRVAYRLTLLRFLTLQMQGSERWPAHAGAAASEPVRARRAVAARRSLRRSTCWRRRICDRRLPASRRPRSSSPARATRWCRSRRRARWLRRLPHATHTTIAGAAHAPFLSHPAPFLDALAAFVDG